MMENTAGHSVKMIGGRNFKWRALQDLATMRVGGIMQDLLGRLKNKWIGR